MLTKRTFLRSPVVLLILLCGALALPAGLVGACSATPTGMHFGAGGAGGASSSSGSTGGATTMAGTGGTGGVVISFDANFDSPACGSQCSADITRSSTATATSCTTCARAEACDADDRDVRRAVQRGEDTSSPSAASSTRPTWISTSRASASRPSSPTPGTRPSTSASTSPARRSPSANFARIPSGAGPSLTYTAYNPVGGLPPGTGGHPLPRRAAGQPVACARRRPRCHARARRSSTAAAWATRSTSRPTLPVAAYEINPYGGGSAAVTGASLLLPTSVWDTNYVAVTVTPYDIYGPSMNIIAAEDNTTVTMLPKVAVGAAAGSRRGRPTCRTPSRSTRGRGAVHADADLTGTVIQSNNPIGFMAGQPCMRWPKGVAYCDHGEQMVPPISALGSEYVGVMYRPPGDGRRARLAHDRHDRRHHAHLLDAPSAAPRPSAPDRSSTSRPPRPSTCRARTRCTPSCSSRT